LLRDRAAAAGNIFDETGIAHPTKRRHAHGPGPLGFDARTSSDELRVVKIESSFGM